MTSINPERKDYLLAKMLTTSNLNVRQFSEEHGVSRSALYTWLKAHHLESTTMTTSKTTKPDNWSGERKLNVLIETASFNKQELSTYCRENGLYVEQIARWKTAAINGNEGSSSKTRNPLLTKEKKHSRHLERELRRKEKALAEAAALLILRKKAQAIWGDDADE